MLKSCTVFLYCPVRTIWVYIIIDSFIDNSLLVHGLIDSRKKGLRRRRRRRRDFQFYILHSPDELVPMSDTFPEGFRAKRGSCSCSTSGTQFSCSCCQGIKGLKGKSHFVVECRLVNSADYTAIQGPLLKCSLSLCLSDYGFLPPPLYLPV